jgi:hypothetical protein
VFVSAPEEIAKLLTVSFPARINVPPVIESVDAEFRIPEVPNAVVPEATVMLPPPRVEEIDPPLNRYEEAFSVPLVTVPPLRLTLLTVSLCVLPRFSKEFVFNVRLALLLSSSEEPNTRVPLLIVTLVALAVAESVVVADPPTTITPFPSPAEMLPPLSA